MNAYLAEERLRRCAQLALSTSASCLVASRP